MDLYYNITLILGGFVGIVSGAISFYNGPKKSKNMTWFVLNIVTAVWSFGYFFMINSTDKNTALISNLILHYAAILIPTLHFLFVLALTQTFKKHKYKLIFFSFMALFFLAINHTKLFIQDVFPKYIFNYAPDAGSYYKYFLAYFVLITAYGLFVIYQRLRETAGEEYRRLKYLLTLLIIGFSGGASVFFLTFNVNFPPYPIILFSLYPIIVTLAIVRHNLFDAKVVATELLITAIWVFLLVRTIIAETAQEKIIDGALLVLLIFFGILLIRSVNREIRTRVRIEELAKNLEKANTELQRLDQEKSDFLSIASHQLRTPMTVIKGYISMMQEGMFGQFGNEAKEVMSKVYISNQRLIKLINDLLDVSRIEHGKMKYDFQKQSLEKVIQEVFNEFKAGAENKNLILNYEKPQSKLPKITFDAEYIRQVIINLLDNAIKYTPSGEIKISLSSTPEKITIKIKDSGEGITSEEMKKLFKRYQRGVKEGVKGLGIGLYLAKKIIDDHKGKIWAESEGSGKGSIFFVELPVS